MTRREASNPVLPHVDYYQHLEVYKLESNAVFPLVYELFAVVDTSGILKPLLGIHMHTQVPAARTNRGAHSPAACAAWFQMGRSPVLGHGPGVGEPCSGLLMLAEYGNQLTLALPGHYLSPERILSGSRTLLLTNTKCLQGH